MQLQDGQRIAARKALAAQGGAHRGLESPPHSAPGFCLGASSVCAGDWVLSPLAMRQSPRVWLALCLLPVLQKPVCSSYALRAALLWQRPAGLRQMGSIQPIGA